jgi:RNA polymerase sigma-70 factor (ECF subfamily)
VPAKNDTDKSAAPVRLTHLVLPKARASNVRETTPTMTRPQDDLPTPGPVRGETIEEIYDRYAPQVERWVRRLAGPRWDTEDLLHDIFLVVLRRRHEFRGEAKITTWLFGITQQIVRWRRRKDALRRLLWGTHGPAVAEARATVPTPVEEVERREACVRLYAALDRMPEKYRTTLMLFALEGLSGEEVAALTGTDTNTVWARLHRARARLAVLLAAGEAPSP